MKKTETRTSTNHMDFVYKLHQTMLEKKLSLVYEGEVNQSITKVFTSLAERNMEETEENTTTKRRVYHVMVECLQNICKHTDDVETGEPEIPGTGIFIVANYENEYLITTGNIIAKEKIFKLTEMLTNINSLNKEELKALYKVQIKNSRLSDKGGAGLGLIDIAKKTGSKLDFHFEAMNDKSSFFILTIKINKTTKT